MTLPDQLRINASVSKSFFVEMLVKDISLPMAVHDLVDNCIDGAIRLRGRGRLDELGVELWLSGAEFSIKDNCGGIDLETAVNHAFRFGRPKDAPGVPHSIGRFGVGMKRAVFKLGQHFRVSSVSSRSRFELEVDVPRWEQEEAWEFSFKSAETVGEPFLESQRGTTVGVTGLFSSVSEQFFLEYSVNNLRSSIADVIRSILSAVFP